MTGTNLKKMNENGRVDCVNNYTSLNELNVTVELLPVDRSDCNDTIYYSTSRCVSVQLADEGREGRCKMGFCHPELITQSKL